MIYFIHGPDRLLALQFTRERASEVDPVGENTSWFDARETSLDALLAAVGSISLFGGSRVVIVTDFLGRSNRDGSSGEPAAKRDERTSRADKGLLQLLTAVPEENCLILLESTLSSPPAALKAISIPVSVFAAEPPRGSALVAWICEVASKAGSRIDKATAQLLAETLFPQTWNRKPNNPRFDRPPDLGLLSQEIEKLALFVHPVPITAGDVRSLVLGGPDQRVFRFLDAVNAGELAAAVLDLERLNAAGEEPAMLLAQLHGQAELGIVAQAAGNKDLSVVARDVGSISPAHATAAMGTARRHPSRSVDAVSNARLIDRRLKTGRIRRPDDALYDLMLRSSIRSSD